jgi:hypothetical protein
MITFKATNTHNFVEIEREKGLVIHYVWVRSREFNGHLRTGHRLMTREGRDQRL